MILDSLENLEKYAGAFPYFNKVLEFFKNTDFSKLKPGRIVLDADNLFVNVMELEPKGREDAPIEAHADYIDIQVPITADEVMGFMPASQLGEPSVPYSKERDVAFYPGLSDWYMNVRRGMFAVFFPGEGHAPGCTENGVLKFIMKIKV